jgi:hypothetical protein
MLPRESHAMTKAQAEELAAEMNRRSGIYKATVHCDDTEKETLLPD